MRTTLAGLALLALTGNTLAANTGELWEVSTTMNVPGMPSGMGARSSRVCTDKNESPGAGRKDCKVSNLKRSGLTESMTVTCPDGTMTVEMTYNAARTEYKGKMTVSGGRRGEEMQMTTNGRKLGACDPQVAQAERQQQAAAMNKKVEGAMASARATSADQAKRCQGALETMNAGDVHLGFLCNNNPNSCKTDAEDRMGQRAMYDTCKASAVEFCKRYQTMEGFAKAKADENAAQQCKVSTSQLKASFCPRAEKADDFNFVTAYCPAERQRLVKKHCTGRDFTSMPRRLRLFCQGNVSDESLMEASDRKPSQPAPQSTKDSVTEGVSQGINKLKGLFGR